MNIEIENREEIKKTILDSTIKGVESFLKENPDLEFYAFAFDTNAAYGQINLCFNTEAAFQETVKKYYAHYTKEEVEEVKYNPGDWNYQCFETFYPLEEEEVDKMVDKFSEDEFDNVMAYLVDFFTDCLIEFTKTETYTKIPKTKNFLTFCVDHDEGVEDALERMDAKKCCS